MKATLLTPLLTPLAGLGMIASAIQPSCLESPSKATAIYVGYAEVGLTPPEGTIMGGYGALLLNRKSTGTHDPIMGQVAAFTNDLDEAFIIITIDATGFFYEFGDWGPGVAALRRRIVRNLSDRITLTPEQILVTSSHSHNGPDLIGFWQRPGEGPNLEYLNQVQDGLTEAVMLAMERLEPGELWFGHNELEGYSGRDDDCSPVLDNSVDIMQVRRSNGQLLFTLANYAKHPTMADYDHEESSADFIWGYRARMRELTGAPAVFMQGYIAAVHSGTKSVEGSGWTRTYNMGVILADNVMATLPQLERARQFDMVHRSTTVACAVEGAFVTFAYEVAGVPKRSIHEDGDKLIVEEIPVSWHALGPAEFAAMPGEASPEYSVMAKSRMTSPFKFAVGLANDELGYLVEPESIVNDTSGRLLDYEVKMGLGANGGPCVWTGVESLDWFDGAALKD